MVAEGSDAGAVNGRLPATEQRRGGGPPNDLVVIGGQRSLPRQERTADGGQRQRVLRQHGQRRTRPGCDELISLTILRIPPEDLGAVGDDGQRTQVQRIGERSERVALLADGVHERPRDLRTGEREDQPRHAASRAEIEGGRWCHRVDERQRAQRVEQVQPRHGIGFRDAGQVQAGVRFEQECDVAFDRIGEARWEGGGDSGRIGLEQAFERDPRGARIGSGIGAVSGLGQKMLLRAAFRFSRE